MVNVLLQEEPDEDDDPDPWGFQARMKESAADLPPLSEADYGVSDANASSKSGPGDTSGTPHLLQPPASLQACILGVCCGFDNNQCVLRQTSVLQHAYRGASQSL